MSGHSQPVIEAAELSHSYGSFPVLQGVSLSVSPGEVLGLVGPNGSGKTTLLRCLYGSITPEAGSVRVGGEELSRIPPKRLARQVAVVVQEPPSELMLSVGDTVLLGRTPHLRAFERAEARDDAIAVEALERVGMRHMAAKEFSLLSGGEKQRVLVARALAQQTHCLLLDEPTNHLDIAYQHEILHLVRELSLTAVVVLHDLNLAARYCNQVLMLAEGKVHARGAPEDVFTPDHVEPIYAVRAESAQASDGTAQLLFRRAEQRHFPGGPEPI